jgi:hypothetical protein
MLRSSCIARCAATAVAPVNVAAVAMAKKHPYYPAFEAARANPESTLSQPAYTFLLEKIDAYRELQAAYAVKQSEVERARKAAAMCGLEMTGAYRGPRRGITDAEGKPTPSFSDQARDREAMAGAVQEGGVRT